MTAAAPLTINAIFAAAVRAAPGQLYLEFGGVRTTYAEMQDQVVRLARGLHALGLGQGDRVVGLMDNSLDAVTVWYATNYIGAIYVPLNTAYKGEFLRHQIGDSGARVVVCEVAYLEDVLAVAPGLGTLEHVLYTGTERAAAGADKPVSPLAAHRLEEGEAPYFEVAPSDLSMIIYTSGTTGLSKGCMVSHNYICDVSRRYCEAIGKRPQDKAWTPMPLFHITGICVAVLTMQACSSAAFARKFSVTKFWSDIESSQANFVVLLGTLALLVANAPDTPESLRYHGKVRTLIGVPMTEHLAEIWKRRFGVTWCAGKIYGSTECGQALNASLEEPVPDGCCGRVNDTFEVRIVDESDEEVPPNTVGEIVVRPKRADVMFSGYWNNPEATIKAWRTLWHHMGDNGRVDENGNFFFVDRSKDVIRRRGENISSFELEATFNQHPGIMEAAVHAVPSEFMEDEVKATVIRQPEATMSEPELLEWARSRLPRFALPRFIEFRDELPKNPSGRVLKFQLREEGVTGTTWDRDQS